MAQLTRSILSNVRTSAKYKNAVLSRIHFGQTADSLLNIAKHLHFEALITAIATASIDINANLC